jgi:hypothetical protein
MSGRFRLSDFQKIWKPLETLMIERFGVLANSSTYMAMDGHVLKIKTYICLESNKIIKHA